MSNCLSLNHGVNQVIIICLCRTSQGELEPYYKLCKGNHSSHYTWRLSDTHKGGTHDCRAPNWCCIPHCSDGNYIFKFCDDTHLILFLIPLVFSSFSGGGDFHPVPGSVQCVANLLFCLAQQEHRSGLAWPEPRSSWTHRYSVEEGLYKHCANSLQNEMIASNEGRCSCSTLLIGH